MEGQSSTSPNSSTSPQPEMDPLRKRILDETYRHPRDCRIRFIEETHQYFILPEGASYTDPGASFDHSANEEAYISVTTWNHEFFEEFNADLIISRMQRSRRYVPGHKYWGMTPEEIKDMWEKNRVQASDKGTALHKAIEDYFAIPVYPGSTQTDFLYEHFALTASVGGDPNRVTLEGEIDGVNVVDTVEWKGFMNFVKEYPRLVPYRSEWRVFHEELKLAGTIDMLYLNPNDGSVVIVDWKRSKAMEKRNNYGKSSFHDPLLAVPDTNFWHYTLQLNVYRFILESKYGFRVSGMFLVQMHPDLGLDPALNNLAMNTPKMGEVEPHYRVYQVDPNPLIISNMVTGRMVKLKSQ